MSAATTPTNGKTIPITSAGSAAPSVTPRTSRPRRNRWTLLAGLLVGLLVAAAGSGYALLHPPTWAAERSVVIVPDSSDPTQQAALYDSLSRGQVAATAAEIYGQYKWHASTPDVVVSAGVVPPSAVLEVTASGTDRAEVEQTLTRVLDVATVDLNRVLVPYQAMELNTAPVAAHTTGLSSTAWIAIAVFAGLFLGSLTVAAVNAVRSRLAASRQRDEPPLTSKRLRR